MPLSSYNPEGELSSGVTKNGRLRFSLRWSQTAVCLRTPICFREITVCRVSHSLPQLWERNDPSYCRGKTSLSNLFRAAARQPFQVDRIPLYDRYQVLSMQDRMVWKYCILHARGFCRLQGVESSWQICATSRSVPSKPVGEMAFPPDEKRNKFVTFTADFCEWLSRKGASRTETM